MGKPARLQKWKPEELPFAVSRMRANSAWDICSSQSVSTLIGSYCEPYHPRAATENPLSEVQPDLKGSRPQQAVSPLFLILSPQTKRRRRWEVLYRRQMKRESRTDKLWKPTVDKASMKTVFVIKEAYCFIEEEGKTWGCHREWFGWH